MQINLEYVWNAIHLCSLCLPRFYFEWTGVWDGLSTYKILDLRAWHLSPYYRVSMFQMLTHTRQETLFQMNTDAKPEMSTNAVRSFVEEKTFFFIFFVHLFVRSFVRLEIFLKKCKIFFTDELANE